MNKQKRLNLFHKITQIKLIFKLWIRSPATENATVLSQYVPQILILKTVMFFMSNIQCCFINNAGNFPIEKHISLLKTDSNL